MLLGSVLGLALLSWSTLVSRIYLASDGGVGTELLQLLLLALALKFELPPPARNASSVQRMFAVGAKRPRERTVASRTITGGDMSDGRVGSSYFFMAAADAAEKDETGGCEDHKSIMTSQLCGLVCGVVVARGRCDWQIKFMSGTWAF
jgi:hypothetical protein